MNDHYDDFILYGLKSMPHLIFLNKGGLILDISAQVGEEELIEKLDLAI